MANQKRVRWGGVTVIMAHLVEDADEEEFPGAGFLNSEISISLGDAMGNDEDGLKSTKGGSFAMKGQGLSDHWGQGSGLLDEVDMLDASGDGMNFFDSDVDFLQSTESFSPSKAYAENTRSSSKTSLDPLMNRKASSGTLRPGNLSRGGSNMDQLSSGGLSFQNQSQDLFGLSRDSDEESESERLVLEDEEDDEEPPSTRFVDDVTIDMARMRAARNKKEAPRAVVEV